MDFLEIPLCMDFNFFFCTIINLSLHSISQELLKVPQIGKRCCRLTHPSPEVTSISSSCTQLVSLVQWPIQGQSSLGNQSNEWLLSHKAAIAATRISPPYSCRNRGRRNGDPAPGLPARACQGQSQLSLSLSLLFPLFLYLFISCI